MAIFGYARASLNLQSLEEQIQRICQAGVDPQDIFTDEPVRCQSELRGLNVLKNKAKEGDIIMVTRLDRLGRNLSESIHLVDYFNKREVSLQFVDDGFGTENAQGNLIVAVLTAVEQAERRRLQERTSEGRIEAKEKGVKFGRKPSVDRNMIQMMRSQGAKATEIARQMKVGRSTVYKILQSLLKGE